MKSELVIFRLTPEELVELDELAGTVGVTRSEWLRRSIGLTPYKRRHKQFHVLDEILNEATDNDKLKGLSFEAPC